MTTKKEKISGGVPKNPVMKYLYLNKGILAGALGIFLVFGFLTEFKFWGRANVINILRITSLDSIAAFGVTLIIITGGIDLSVGALMACASTYCALLISNGLHPAGALLVGVLIATVFGAINGGIVANTKIPPFIVTLGTMNIGRGIAYTCSAGTPIRISGDFGEIGNGYLMNTIPYPIIYTAVILAITYVLLNKTKFGREVYAIGGNAEAARFSGINSKKVIWIVVVVLVVLFISGSCSAYNRMVTAEETVNTTWADVEAQYQRRSDLIPNLVNTVKGYAAHEQSTFTEVVEARAQAMSFKLDAADLTPEKLAEFQQAQQKVGSALGRLIAVAEQYPDLKANQNFLELQAQLEGTENRIAVARTRFNDATRQYNVTIRRFPANLIAGMFGFDQKAYFAAEEGAQTVPEVKF